MCYNSKQFNALKRNGLKRNNSRRKFYRRKQVMAENRGNLTSYRPDIKVMDCTLRDGGLVNNFEFTDEFVKDLY